MSGVPTRPLGQALHRPGRWPPRGPRPGQAAAMHPILLALSLTSALALGPAMIAPPGIDAPQPRAAPAAVEAGQWPLRPAVVVAGFDPPDQPWGSGHRGVDLRGLPGQPVLAALSGTVAFAGSIAGRGVVVVDHGARRTTYEPVLSWVEVGQRILAGQPLGALAQAGSHCAPAACLHWGLREGERYLDPLSLVQGGPVRLLPLMPAGGPAGRRS